MYNHANICSHIMMVEEKLWNFMVATVTVLYTVTVATVLYRPITFLFDLHLFILSILDVFCIY